MRERQKEREKESKRKREKRKGGRSVELFSLKRNKC